MVWRFPSRTATKVFVLFLIVAAAKTVALTQDIPKTTGSAPDNVVIRWNNAALQTIRYRRPWPTINARVLAVTHTCMYDAWAAYDDKALATSLGSQLRLPANERTEQNKITAANFAPHPFPSHLFPTAIALFSPLLNPRH